MFAVHDDTGILETPKVTQPPKGCPHFFLVNILESGYDYSFYKFISIFKEQWILIQFSIWLNCDFVVDYADFFSIKLINIER